MTLGRVSNANQCKLLYTYNCSTITHRQYTVLSHLPYVELSHATPDLCDPRHKGQATRWPDKVRPGQTRVMTTLDMGVSICDHLCLAIELFWPLLPAPNAENLNLNMD